MMLDGTMVARALGGVIIGQLSVLAPGPGHSRADRSLSIKIDPKARDGFVLHSFAGDPIGLCYEHVRNALGLTSNESQLLNRIRSMRVGSVVEHPVDRSEFALRLWHEARDPRGSMVTDYLSSRGLTLSDDVAGDVVRFHPTLKYKGSVVGGMVALFRDIMTNTPCGVQRTFLDRDGRKLDRRMLGRAKQAAIKIDADETVTMGLTIGEGFETSLAARLAGFRPVWAVGSAGGIENFPVLPGVDAVTMLGELGDGGANERANQKCAARWCDAGQEAFIVTPLTGDDFNDAWREVSP
jgi:hypothetical protein